MLASNRRNEKMNQANYLLIDGVLRPDALKQLYQRDEPIEVAPLYLGTRWAEIMDLGPVLVRTAHPSELIAQWHRHPEQRIDACIFFSNASLKIVSEHLQRFLSPLDYLGHSSLLRFADPLVMHYWLSSYDPEHLNSTLGPIDQLWVQSPLRNWQQNLDPAITTFVNERAQKVSRAHFPLVSERQLQAFESCHRWLFEGRLYEWIKKQDPVDFPFIRGMCTTVFIENDLFSVTLGASTYRIIGWNCIRWTFHCLSDAGPVSMGRTLIRDCLR